jgi:hypothetical protein
MLLAEIGTPSYLIVARRTQTSTMQVSVETVKPMLPPPSAPTESPSVPDTTKSNPSVVAVVRPSMSGDVQSKETMPEPKPDPPAIEPPSLPEITGTDSVITFPPPAWAVKKGRIFSHVTDFEKMTEPFRTMMSLDAEEAFKKSVGLWVVVRGAMKDKRDGGWPCGHCIEISLHSKLQYRPYRKGISVFLEFNKRWLSKIDLIQKGEKIEVACDILHGGEAYVTLTDCNLAPSSSDTQ